MLGQAIHSPLLDIPPDKHAILPRQISHLTRLRQRALAGRRVGALVRVEMSASVGAGAVLCWDGVHVDMVLWGLKAS
jgi:hypothetical protein